MAVGSCEDKLFGGSPFDVVRRAKLAEQGRLGGVCHGLLRIILLVESLFA
jgi:hypothetical protein